MAAYYNEFDPFAAAWLRELIKDGLIADGVVDERSIVDVEPQDLREFTQCHFFAGIGGWSYAARLAGWDDNRPMWSGSPPCQPFSTAGNRKGKDDLRHLWPVFFNLIRECQPPAVFGEQVASAIRMGWFCDLQADMEAEGYATAMAVLPACSVGAPHKRDRLFYVAKRMADTLDPRQPANSWGGESSRSSQEGNYAWRSGESSSGMADTSEDGWRERPSEGWSGREWGSSIERRSEIRQDTGDSSRSGSSLADTNAHGWEQGVQPLQGGASERSRGYGIDHTGSRPLGDTNDQGLQEHRQLGELHLRESNRAGENGQCIDSGISGGFWGDSRLVWCRDNKFRPIPTEPALFPVAARLPNRVGILRGAGNAIVPQVGAEIIKAYMESN